MPIFCSEIEIGLVEEEEEEEEARWRWPVRRVLRGVVGLFLRFRR